MLNKSGIIGGEESFIGEGYGVFILTDTNLAIVDVVLNTYRSCMVLGHASPMASRAYSYSSKESNKLYATLDSNADGIGNIHVIRIM